MSKLDKGTVGLDKVLNRLQLDKGDYNLIMNKLNKLERTVEIIGNLSNLQTLKQVSLDTNGNYVIKLNNVKIVNILIDLDDKGILFEGGLEGDSYFVMLRSANADNVRFINTRVPYGTNIGTTPGTPESNGVTTFSVTKLGGEYYSSNLNYRVV